MARFTFGDFFHDLKTSRYCQVWCALWLGCIIAFIVGLAHFGQQAQVNATDYTYRLRRELREALPYPDFHLMLFNHTHTTFQTVACSTSDGHEVVWGHCNTLPQTICRATQDAGTLQALYHQHNRLTCLITLASVDGGALPYDASVKFNFRDEGEWGKTTFIKPGDKAEIYIALEEFTMGYAANDVNLDWQTTFAIAPGTPGVAQFDLIFSSFWVNHWLAYDSYTGWMSFASVFGTLFGLYVLHSVVMFAIAFVLPNNAKSLGGSDSEYDSIPSSNAHASYPRASSTGYESVPQ